MVKRQASRGEYAGKLFWACSRYPECRALVPIGSRTAG
jgi:ssDNA-binding Zn-finger/Zn-ribbon topoisomerase 1